MIKKKRFRTGKGIFEGDYPSEAIIDEETGERYYDGIKLNYISSKEICELLNELNDRNEQLKKDMLKNENKESYGQCPRVFPCSFCSCIMKLVKTEEKQVIYRCPCCQKYKFLERKYGDFK